MKILASTGQKNKRTLLQQPISLSYGERKFMNFIDISINKIHNLSKNLNPFK